MKEFIRCKACGFITTEDKGTGKCPACGVPHTAFEPYKLTISEKRKKLLELHLHPIALHFPQAFAMMGFLLVLLIPFLSGNMKDMVVHTAKLMITLLPFAVLLGFATGLFDGRLRFKKVTTPILKIKMLLGIGLLVFSVISAIFIQSKDLNATVIMLEILSLLLCNICAAILGKLGSSLLESKLPG